MLSIARAITQWAKDELDGVFKQARRIMHTPQVDIKVALTKREFGKLIIIVPRTIGNAVKRNLFRRRVKTIFYQNGFYKFHYDWIVFAKKGVFNLSFVQLQEMLDSVLQKLPRDS